MKATYILPIRRMQIDEDLNELTSYLYWLATQVEVIVVDGSSANIFAAHHAYWNSFIKHIPPDTDVQVANGKVKGVLSGLRRATYERVVIADDDVRYDFVSLPRLLALLEHVAVVRPQNYFESLPWHAYWDTARTLLNRVTGGDWPGTLGVRLSLLQATGGYDGNVLFENLELVRTIRAVGGKELVALDLFVRRKSPRSHHFWSQRIRQAYDEFARPVRFVVSLAVLPLTLGLALRRQWLALAVAFATLVCSSEIGRQRNNGRHVFPFIASLLAPAWLMERAICVWLALGVRLFLGGVPYHGIVLSRAANSERVLRQRYRERSLHFSSTPLLLVEKSSSFIKD